MAQREETLARAGRRAHVSPRSSAVLCHEAPRVCVRASPEMQDYGENCLRSSSRVRAGEPIMAQRLVRVICEAPRVCVRASPIGPSHKG